MTYSGQSPFLTYLPVPPWAKSIALTVSLGPIADAASSQWIIVQQREGGGKWADVGGVIASGRGSTASGTTRHPASSTTAYRLASNVAMPSYNLVVT